MKSACSLTAQPIVGPFRKDSFNEDRFGSSAWLTPGVLSGAGTGTTSTSVRAAPTRIRYRATSAGCVIDPPSAREIS